MRFKYDTRGIVLARSPLGEANALVMLITPALGLLRARAQGIRKPGAKLAASLTTFAESDFVLVRGKEGWRIAGAVLGENWFTKMQSASVRSRAGRIGGLLSRLVAGEAHDTTLFPVLNSFFEALTQLPEDMHDAAEIVAALRILATLGLDAGEIPGEVSDFTEPTLSSIMGARAGYIARINAGIIASGL